MRSGTHSIAAAPHIFAKCAFHASTTMVDAWSARFAKMCGVAAMECVSLGVRFSGIGGGGIGGGGSGSGIGG
eukprot:10074344-Lingulodinium_polyedra.AAC.1